MANATAGLPEGFTLDYNVPVSPVESLKQQQAVEGGGDVITVSKPVPVQQATQPEQTIDVLPEGFTMDYNNPSDNEVDTSVAKAKKDAADPALVASPTYITYAQDKWESYAGKIASDYQDSVRQATEAFARGGKGEQTNLETAFQVTGDAFNLFGDILGTTVIEGIGIAGDGLSAVVPDFIEDPIKGKIKEGLDWVGSSEVAKQGLEALGKGLKAWEEFEQSNPRAAENIKSVVDIGTVLYPAGKAAKPIANSAKLEKKASELSIKAAKDAKTKTAMKFMDSFDNLASKDNRMRMRDGVIPIDSLTAREQKAIKAVQSTKGYNTMRSSEGNLNAVNKELDRANEELAKIIARDGDVQINVQSIFDDFGAKADKAVADARGTALSEKTQKAYVDILSIAEDAIAANGNTAKGLRQARIEIDKAFKELAAGEDPFSKSSVLKDAVNDIRDTINDRIAMVIPETKPAMDKVSGLYHAQKQLASKAKSSNAFVDAVRNTMHVVGLQRDLGWLLVAVAGGSYAATATSIGAAAAVGGGLYLGGKGIKKGISAATGAKARSIYLKSWSEAMKTVDAGSDMAKQLRADRETVMTVLKDLVEIGEDNYIYPEDKEAAMQPLKITVTKGQQ